MHTHPGELIALAAHDPDVPGCLVTDLIMPDMSGLELQSVLSARGIVRPIVFITARGDVPTTVQGMRAGAVSFLSEARAQGRAPRDDARSNLEETPPPGAQLAGGVVCSSCCSASPRASGKLWTWSSRG